jgi:hypothetical protein
MLQVERTAKRKDSVVAVNSYLIKKLADVGLQGRQDY